MQTLTRRQEAVLEVYHKTLSTAETARQLNVTQRSIQYILSRIKAKGYHIQVEKNLSENQPQGWVSPKVTVQEGVDEHGKPVVERRWLRYTPTQDALEQFHQSIENKFYEMADQIDGPLPDLNNGRLMCIVPGDPHFGLLAWAKESGSEYNLDIAQKLHETAFRYLLEKGVKNGATKAIIAPVGDVVESDNNRRTTARSNNHLMSDHYWKVVDCLTKSLLRTIEYAAKLYQTVYLTIPPGNHDWHTSGHISRVLKAYYAKTKRIRIDTRPTKQRYVEFGKVLLGFAHSDTEKVKHLPQLMATDQCEAWGRTKLHVWHTGHDHKRRVDEVQGCIVEGHNTLAANGQYAAEGGWRSQRKMTGIIYDRELGEYSRFKITHERVEAILAEKG